MELHEFLIIAISALFFFKICTFVQRFHHSQFKKSHYPYFKNSSLLTPAEISFRHSLKMAVGDACDISFKVRLADMITVNRGMTKTEWSSAFNQIKAKHVDFVLVDKETTAILCAIELDDSSHDKPERQKRDAFLEAALKSANLPLFRFKANHAYKSKEIKEAIKSAVDLPIDIAPSLLSETKVIDVFIEPENDVNETNETAILRCPQCNAELVEREASKGRHVGVKFLGCSNFPECRYRKVVGETD